MKKIFLLLCFLPVVQTAFTQSPGMDTILQKIAAEKDDYKRLDLVMKVYTETFETKPELTLQNLQAVLSHSQKSNDKLTEGLALVNMGACYRSMGNTVKGLELCFKAKAIAEQTGNLYVSRRAKHILGVIYKDRGDDAMAISQFLAALDDDKKISKDPSQLSKAFIFMNLGQMYLKVNKPDSALMYSQRAYEIGETIKEDFGDNMAYVLCNLGTLQGKKGNHALAVSYFNMGIDIAVKSLKPRTMSYAYGSFSEYYHDINKIDSSILYAKNAIAALQNTPFINYAAKPAKALAVMYKKINADSALKYYELYTTANDSLFNVKTVQQAQLLSFEEEQRKQDASHQKIKDSEERKQNIQYVLIALGIISLISLYLLLSRSFITNTKLIEFFGVIALLIVFEFLNLLLHPFLERITNHSPVLMLLVLVCIAALLVPLHHKVEKWATAKLVEKNKKIRLAAAKKTIQQLDTMPDDKSD